tara:strand:+ start:271 stop:396 length:126 start_codon:yes stop_codon:yes gene_type:complete
MEQKDKIQSLLGRIEELEQQIMDLRMGFLTALDLIETYKEA